MFNEASILELLAQGQAQGVFSKAVAGFVLPDGSYHTVTLDTDADTIFDIASLTKVCPTSTLALCAILQGKLDVDTKVIDFIPELRTNYRDDIRIFHLLTHSLDYRVPMKTLRTLPPEGILEALYSYQFQIPPGKAFNYGNPASVLLGIVLNRLTGKSLQKLGRETFFDPLGMERSGWDPLERFPKEQIMPTEKCAFRGRTIQGEIHDESAWVLRRLFPVGSAGMFSTVPDLLRFVKMVLNDGVYEGRTIAPAGLLDMVSQNAFAPEVGAETALGWELNAERFMGKRRSPRTFGKTGFTGASIVADPERGAAAVLLSNFTWPHREPSADRINQFRAALSDLFFSQV